LYRPTVKPKNLKNLKKTFSKNLGFSSPAYNPSYVLVNNTETAREHGAAGNHARALTKC